MRTSHECHSLLLWASQVSSRTTLTWWRGSSSSSMWPRWRVTFCWWCCLLWSTVCTSPCTSSWSAWPSQISVNMEYEVLRWFKNFKQSSLCYLKLLNKHGWCQSLAVVDLVHTAAEEIAKTAWIQYTTPAALLMFLMFSSLDFTRKYEGNSQKRMTELQVKVLIKDVGGFRSLLNKCWCKIDWYSKFCFQQQVLIL